jgi:hypothetical protein
MALTNKTALDARNYMPRHAAIPEELDENIIAAPLVVPEYANVRPKKDKGIAFRWVNFAVPTKEGGFTSLRLDQMIAAGFVYAQPDDIEGTCPQSLMRDGKIRYGDLILLKIDAKTYNGALKYNWERSIKLASRAEEAAQGTRQVQQAVAEVTRRPDLANKIRTFQPSEAEIANLGKAVPMVDGKPALPVTGAPTAEQIAASRK